MLCLDGDVNETKTFLNSESLERVVIPVLKLRSSSTTLLLYFFLFNGVYECRKIDSFDVITRPFEKVTKLAFFWRGGVRE